MRWLKIILRAKSLPTKKEIDKKKEENKLIPSLPKKLLALANKKK
jgi:hypothetical protein